MDVVGIAAGDRTNKYHRAALVLRTLGWMSIIWAFMISVWIWMGEKAGSQLWLWWTLGHFAFGAACLAVAKWLHVRAAHVAGAPALEEELRDRDRAA